MKSVEKIIYEEILSGAGLCTDSRKVLKNGLFIALKGDNFDGNKFAHDALKNGCKLAIIDNPELKSDNRFMLVSDVLKTIQNIAQYHRSQFDIPFIGITGSNGKTTTKELIKSVLSKKFKTYATKGNFNNHIGVPLTILSVKADAEIAIIEMGANHVGEIRDLCQLSKPNYGIITNIGRAHLEGFGSIGNIVKAKSELYEYIRTNKGKLFVNFDNKKLMELSGDITKITYGQTVGSDYSGNIEKSDTYLNISYWAKNIPEKKNKIITNLVGNYNFENLMAAICVGYYFGVEKHQVKEALEAYIPENNRSQLVKTQNNTILMDAYNANPSSMTVAIENFSSMNYDNKVVILGDMLELGKNAQKEHAKILDLALNENYKHVILVGNDFFSVAERSDKVMCFYDNKQLINWLKENSIKNCAVLIKGSRGIQLEEILDYL